MRYRRRSFDLLGISLKMLRTIRPMKLEMTKLQLSCFAMLDKSSAGKRIRIF